jgi:hypothetical protein
MAWPDGKYTRYRNDDANTMHLALLTTLRMVRGSRRTPIKNMRVDFNTMFRVVLKQTETWTADYPGYFRRH